LYNSSDYFTVLPVSIEAISANTISVFPNQADAALNIQNKAACNLTYEIVSIIGKTILTNTSSDRTIRIEVHDLAPEAYFV